VFAIQCASNNENFVETLIFSASAGVKKNASARSERPRLFERGKLPWLAAVSVDGGVVELDGHARRGKRERQSESEKDGLHGGSPSGVECVVPLAAEMGRVVA
jgi:hypothetical protein